MPIRRNPLCHSRDHSKLQLQQRQSAGDNGLFLLELGPFSSLLWWNSWSINRDARKFSYSITGLDNQKSNITTRFWLLEVLGMLCSGIYLLAFMVVLNYSGGTTCRARRSGNIRELQLSSPISALKHFLSNKSSQLNFLAQVSRIKYLRASARLCDREQPHWKVVDIQETSEQVFFSQN